MHGTDLLSQNSSATRVAAPALRHLEPVLLDPGPALALPTRSAMNWPRKIFHMIGIGSTGLTLALSSLESAAALLIISCVAALVVTPDLLRFWFPSFNERVFRDFGFIMRDYEQHRMSGMSWFLLGMILVLSVAPPAIAGLAVLLLAFGDPWASIIGIRFGKRRILGGRKTLEGVLGGFAVCFVVSVCYFGLSGLVSAGAVVPAALLAAAAAAFAETISGSRVDDNFAIPVICAPVLVGLIAVLG